jgi:hypothetical protein
MKIGDALGEFKIEAEIVEFIAVGPKKKISLLKDGTLKNSFGKPDLTYFRTEASQMINMST